METRDAVRILQVLGCLDRGGAETMVMNLYRSMDASKLQFDFVVHTKSKGAYDSEVKKLGGRIYHAPRYCVLNHVQYVMWWKKFLRNHSEYKVMHAHIRSTAAIFLSIAKHMERITIAHSHSTSNGAGFQGMVKDIWQWPIRYVADYLFSCSDEAGKWLFGKRAVQGSNYRIIPNGIDCRQFAYSEIERGKVREELGIEGNCFVIGHIGRFHEAKNHKFLLQVFKKILGKTSNARLLLVGDGKLRKEMEQRCKSLGISEQTIFAGLQPHPERFYQAMDIFLFPSLWEGLPMSVIEAQVAGLPCIISDKITGNAQLTDLVMYESIDKMPIVWAERCMKYIGNIRTGLNMEQKKKMKKFDSANVAKEMEKFYMEASRGGQR